VARPITDNLERYCDTPEQSLGYVLTQLRVKRNWPQEYVAEKSGYSLRYFVRVERGGQNPTYRFLLAVAPLFGLRPSQLLSRAESKHKQRLKKRATAPAGSSAKPIKKPS
jgi:transcriptional regulator with XRE-family HTH domain